MRLSTIFGSIVLIASFALLAPGADISALSCQQSDVQAAINSSATGDRVFVPSGICTWSATVSIPSTKGITLQGGGIGQTIIVDAITSQPAIRMTVGSVFQRVTGFTFDSNGVAKTGLRSFLEVTGAGLDLFRVDHVHFRNIRSRGITVVQNANEMSGVIDHNIFDAPFDAAAQAITVVGGAVQVSTHFARPLELGSRKYIFAEDNVFNFSYANDGLLEGYGGARYVFRYNIIHGGSQGHHGTDSGNYRGTHSFEIYGNYADEVGYLDTDEIAIRKLHLRSGTGVIFDNSWSREYGAAHVDNYRSCGSYGAWGTADGNNRIDGNDDPSGEGYPALDQIGTVFTDVLDGSHTHVPLYFWNNNQAGVQTRLAVATRCARMSTLHLLENRDFYNEAIPFNGTTGIGRGLLASRPVACTANVGYFATDTQTLYRCMSPNSWAAFYSPYLYPHPLTGVADSIAPVRGNSGIIDIPSGSIGSRSLTLNWTRASDNLSPSSSLQYEVRMSSTNNIADVPAAEAHGVVVQPYAPDINTAVVTGLTPGTTYFFNVMVRDQSINKTAYSSVSATTGIALELVAPVPGTQASILGGIAVSGVSASGLNLSWVAATDNATAQVDLQYEVRRSAANNLSTVSAAEANGVIIQPYTANATAFSVTGLSPTTTYYFNVIVKDQEGNKAIYAGATGTTVGDTVSPIPGGGGIIRVSDIGPNFATLDWTEASDNVTPQNALLYEIRRSAANNIDTVTNAEANGVIARGYAAAVDTATFDTLSNSTSYFFNIIVKDAAGNKSIYQTLNFSTTGPDVVPPTPGASGAINVTSVTGNAVTLGWSRATDDISAQPTLLYEVRRSTLNNMSSVANAEANGTVVWSSSADLITVSLGGLSPATTYFFTVIVKDQAGNRAVYQTISATTGVIVDQFPPSATITEPAADSVISGDVSIAANATDDVGVENVQFYLDGLTPIGAPDVISPFQITWNSRSVQDGPHTLSVVARDSVGREGISAVINVVVANQASTFTLPSNGAATFTTTAPPAGSVVVSHSELVPFSGNAPAGIAIISLESPAAGGLAMQSDGGESLAVSSSVLVGEASVPAAPEVSSGIIYVDVGGGVSTGIAFANESSTDAVISYSFTDSTGVKGPQRTLTLSARHQIAAYFTEPPFSVPASFRGTFTFATTVPLGALALRGVTNERGEFVFTTVPVAPTAGLGFSPTLPIFADAGGWTTQIILLNPSSSVQTGTLEFIGQGSGSEGGLPLGMTVNGVTGTSFSYTILPGSATRFVTAGNASAATQVGSVRIKPDLVNLVSSIVPSAFAVLSFRNKGIIVSEASVVAQPAGTAFRAFVENTTGGTPVSSGVALVNIVSSPNLVTLELRRSDGTDLGMKETLVLPPNGQVSKFLGELFKSLPGNFQGVLKISSQFAIGVTELRGHYSTRGDFLITTIPPLNDADKTPGRLVFPHIVSGAGYTTQVILLAPAGPGGSGRLIFTSKDGVPQAGIAQQTP